ncbi:uncharacterized protein LOC136037823 isoform X2 [Artemia franciscana]|uniref:uncharacterized protein LOC136037823 isoform X2 n=1 Tax=Artemia franciscana TaxID=6661 RepID=UPI0032DB0052
MHGIYFSGGMAPNQENNPIHPTVKNLTAGKYPRYSSLNEEVEVKKEVAAVIPQYVPPKAGRSEIEREIRGSRFRSRKRLIIGNISRWLREDERDEASISHKWMVYIRGSKEEPDISTFISKVKFFLHSSYAPNDVVEVLNSPFNLTRRGWGEFPLRAQLHFRHPRDRPIEIVHHIKLDKTYTGLQTLGGESVYDIMVHEGDVDSFDTSSEMTDEINVNINLDVEELDEPDIELPSYIPPEFSLETRKEADFECEIVTDMAHLESTLPKRDLLDLIEKENAALKSLATVKLPTEIHKVQKTNLNSFVKCKAPNGMTYLIHKAMIVNNRLSPSVKNKIQIWQNPAASHIPSTTREISNNNESMKQRTKLLEEIKSMSSKIKQRKWQSTDQLLYYLFSRFPLVDSRCKTFAHRTVLPYTASSDHEILSNWTIGKVRAAELYRAKMIKKIVDECSQDENWSTHRIIRWSRLNGYLPIHAWPLSQEGVLVKLENYGVKNFSSLTVAPDEINFSQKYGDIEEEIIDVIGTDEMDRRVKPKVQVCTRNEASEVVETLSGEDRTMANFLVSHLRVAGYSFESLFEIDGTHIEIRGVEAILVKVWKLAAKDMIRATIAGALSRKRGQRPKEISLIDSAVGIQQSSRFSFLTEENLGKPVVRL